MGTQPTFIFSLFPFSLLFYRRRVTALRVPTLSRLSSPRLPLVPAVRRACRPWGALRSEGQHRAPSAVPEPTPGGCGCGRGWPGTAPRPRQLHSRSPCFGPSCPLGRRRTGGRSGKSVRQQGIQKKNSLLVKIPRALLM